MFGGVEDRGSNFESSALRVNFLGLKEQGLLPRGSNDLVSSYSVELSRP